MNMSDYPTLHLDANKCEGTACSNKGYGCKGTWVYFTLHLLKIKLRNSTVIKYTETQNIFLGPLIQVSWILLLSCWQVLYIVHIRIVYMYGTCVIVCILIILYVFVFLFFFSIVIGNKLIKQNYLITFFHYRLITKCN